VVNLQQVGTVGMLAEVKNKLNNVMGDMTMLNSNNKQENVTIYSAFSVMTFAKSDDGIAKNTAHRSLIERTNVPHNAYWIANELFAANVDKHHV
jgi:hypothetical protein